MGHRPHPEQGYRSCLRFRGHGREYGHDRLKDVVPPPSRFAPSTTRASPQSSVAGWTSAPWTRPSVPTRAFRYTGKYVVGLSPLITPETQEPNVLNEHTLQELRALRLDGRNALLSDPTNQIDAAQLPFEQ